MKRGLGCIFRLFLLLITLIIVVFFIVYAVAPVYEFPAPTPFSGKVINNPYHKLDTALWRKGNFQVQSKVWMGLTDGRKNEAKAIYAVYHQLDYDVVAITDYMKINRFEKDKEGYISAYEHGYGLWKTHQVCLGTNHITWLDYPFYQTLSHKQHILNTLKRHCEVLAIVHPKVRNGYDLNDMKFLSNYDLLEALSHYAISLNYWDLALSSGHPVYIISNDDSHDVLDPTKVGRYCTFFNSKSLQEDDVLSALKSGRAFGAYVNMLEGADFYQKAEDHRNIPILQSVEVENDTLTVIVSEPAAAITFIGQNGIIRKIVSNSPTASYHISDNDQYIRTEILFNNNTHFYLNPVIRHNGEGPYKPQAPNVNYTKTWLLRVFAFFIMLFFIRLIIKFRKRNSTKRKKTFRQSFYNR
ncbi:MAG: hypothetical protein WBH71_03725 [Bacteroidales bacterium]|jgi:hypothetical protein|nr:hypothetical protein [Bacteroidales bacterium]MDI9592846.1 hypothetical protein [Bacteroidota bacterium]HOF81103.1 hypothetical protein [Bacteroidales bacterium]HOR76425.1 hypothetical protein [Bacteroidales bacterium]HPL12396.1 hypothetical protein [Bacteroidales bacterium]